MTYNMSMDWTPTPNSAKARLVKEALEAFSVHGYEGVNVVDVTRQCGVTTGTLYHHFGSKLGLYNFIREELERRVVDRMEGASSVFSSDVHKAVSASILVGFDSAVKLNACRILSEAPQDGAVDYLAIHLNQLCEATVPYLGCVLLASMRSALRMAADGVGAAVARKTLEWILR